MQLSSSLWSEQSRKPSHLSLSSTQASPSIQRVPFTQNRGPWVAEQSWQVKHISQTHIIVNASASEMLDFTVAKKCVKPLNYQVFCINFWIKSDKMWQVTSTNKHKVLSLITHLVAIVHVYSEHTHETFTLLVEKVTEPIDLILGRMSFISNNLNKCCLWEFWTIPLTELRQVSHILRMSVVNGSLDVTPHTSTRLRYGLWPDNCKRQIFFVWSHSLVNSLYV